MALLVALCLVLNAIPVVKNRVADVVTAGLTKALNLDDSTAQQQATQVANGLLNDRLDDEARAATGEEQLRNRQVGLSDRLVIGRAISLSATGQGKAKVQLNIGADDGVTKDRAVVTDGGLLGRITSVSPHTSTVTLLTDDSSVVAARVKGSPTLGALAGRRSGVSLTNARPALSFTVSVGSKVAAGDVLVTAGSPGDVPYPAGIKVGRVVSVDTDRGQPERTAVVRPYATTTGIDIVGVVVQGEAKGKS